MNLRAGGTDNYIMFQETKDKISFVKKIKNRYSVKCQRKTLEIIGGN
jgi:hypothetical protein